MPIVKINKNGVWEEVAGISGHTHIKDEIVGFPTSLPANGGDADTLDGIHASDFVFVDDFTDLKNLVGNIKVSTQIANGTKKAMHKNLLDNSDFSNPINQRGKTTYTSGQYCIDRWVCNSNVAGSLTVESGYVTLSNNGTGITDLYQIFENYSNMQGKRYTIVVNCNGNIYFKSFTMGSAGAGYAFGNTGVSFFSVSGQHVLLRLMNANTTADFYWAALYEGDYTEETLPNYRPKMRSVELLECQRYYQIRTTNNVSAIDMRPSMRIANPTVISVTGGYAYSADL